MLTVDSQEQEISANQEIIGLMVDGETCSYQIEFSSDESTSMYVRLNSLNDVDIFLTKAESYIDQVSEQRLRLGKPIKIEYPQIAFITIIAKNLLPGGFNITYSNEYLPSSEEIPFLQSTNFATIVIMSFIFMPFVILCCCISCGAVKNHI